MPKVVFIFPDFFVIIVVLVLVVCSLRIQRCECQMKYMAIIQTSRSCKHHEANVNKNKQLSWDASMAWQKSFLIFGVQSTAPTAKAYINWWNASYAQQTFTFRAYLSTFTTQNKTRWIFIWLINLQWHVPA